MGEELLAHVQVAEEQPEDEKIFKVRMAPTQTLQALQIVED